MAGPHRCYRIELVAAVAGGGVLLGGAWGLAAADGRPALLAEPVGRTTPSVPFAPGAAPEGEGTHAGPPAAANPSPPPAPAAEAESPLSVRRLVVTTAVEHRQPRPVGGPLPADGRPVVAYVEVTNTSSTRQAIVVTFERPGLQPLGRVRLTVPAGANGWRTWAQTTRIRQAGEWTAVVRSEGGRELGSLAFTAEAGAPAAGSAPESPRQ